METERNRYDQVEEYVGRPATASTDPLPTGASAVTGSAASTVPDTDSMEIDTATQAASGPVGTAQVDEATNALAQRVDQAATTLRQNVAGPDASPIRRMVGETASGMLQKTAQYIERPTLGTIASDLGNAVRRNPLGAMALGVGLGYLLGPTLLGGGQRGSRVQQSSLPGEPDFPTDPDDEPDDSGSEVGGNDRDHRAYLT